MTSGMTSWYQHHVARARRAALGEVRRAFESETLPSGGKGFLLAAEADAIAGTKQAHLKEERRRFFQSVAVTGLIAEIGRLTTEYERKRASHDRDAAAWNPVLYCLGLLVVVALEYPVNLSSFLKIGFLTPAFATASVTLIAVVLAFSSHELGMVVRQWGERFGDNVTGTLKGDSRRKVAVGLMLLMFGAAAIFFSRSYLVKEEIARCEALGGECSSTVSVYGIAFAMNFIVYALGFAWSFGKHDPVPGFMEERYRLDVLKRQLAGRYRSGLEKQLQQRIEEARRAGEQLQRRHADQKDKLPNFGVHNAQFEEIVNLDTRVLALLENYRSQLVAAARDNGIDVQFEFEDFETGDTRERRRLDAGGYLQRRIHLGYA